MVTKVIALLFVSIVLIYPYVWNCFAVRVIL